MPLNCANESRTAHDSFVANNTPERFLQLVDYISQPALMLIAAPLLLRPLGVQQYGTWMLVNSIAATASGLGGGFGDGATK
jgi:hypothetical protein